MPRDGTIEVAGTISGELTPLQNVSGNLSIPTERITPGNYPDLRNKPTINTFTVEGDKLAADYKLQDKMDEATVQEIEAILYLD